MPIVYGRNNKRENTYTIKVQGEIIMGLENVVGVMTGVTLDLLLNYLRNQFPQMEITQIQMIGDKKYQFALHSAYPTMTGGVSCADN
jgi:ABC-type lipoprotein release transport system permease subunit